MRRPNLRRVMRVEVVDRHPEQLLMRIPQMLAGAAVGINEPRVRPQPENGVSGMIDRKVRQTQRLLRLLEIRDVAAYPYQSEDVSLVVLQGQLRRQDHPGIAARIPMGFVLVNQGLPPAHQLLLVGTILRRQFLRVKIAVGLTQQIVRCRCPHDPRHREIRRHEPALGVLDVHAIRQVVDQRAEEIALVLDRVFHVPPLRNVGDRGLAEFLLLRALNRDTAKLRRDGWTALGLQPQLASGLTALCRALAHMVQKGLLVPLRHIIGEGVPRERIALRTEHLGAGEVDLLDVAVLIQGGITQRSEVVEVYVAVPIGFQTPLRGPQLLVLPLQLVLTHFKLVDQAMDLFQQRRRGVLDLLAKELSHLAG